MAHSFTRQIYLVSDDEVYSWEFGRGRVTARAGGSVREEDRTGEGHDRGKDQQPGDDSRGELLIVSLPG